MSWIRRRDWHILSVGDAVFTQDARFQLHRDVGGGSKWTLMIKFLEEKDEGTYVCQVGGTNLVFCVILFNLFNCVVSNEPLHQPFAIKLQRGDSSFNSVMLIMQIS